MLYVSPLKALNYDVERNLRGPLAGIRAAAERLGLPLPDDLASPSAPATRRSASARRCCAARRTS